MADIPNVRLRLANRPENVLLVRQALTGIAESIELDPLELNDVSTAVSEACNNVVLHAYEGEEGPLEVEMYARPGVLRAIVRDRGTGIRPQVRLDGDRHGGIGLPVMLALAHNVEFNDLGDGTEVQLEFATTHAASVRSPAEPEPWLSSELVADEGGADRIGLTIAPAELARTVLPRVLCTLAARAYFSTDRISDAQLLGDALAAHSAASINDGHLDVGVWVAPRKLDVRLSPLRRGGADALDSEVEGLGSVLGRLADSHEVASSGSTEVLALQLAESR